jgi:hypothetical protein
MIKINPAERIALYEIIHCLEILELPNSIQVKSLDYNEKNYFDGHFSVGLCVQSLIVVKRIPNIHLVPTPYKEFKIFHISNIVRILFVEADVENT